jgi:hypothetical protein
MSVQRLHRRLDRVENRRGHTGRAPRKQTAVVTPTQVDLFVDVLVVLRARDVLPDLPPHCARDHIDLPCPHCDAWRASTTRAARQCLTEHSATLCHFYRRTAELLSWPLPPQTRELLLQGDHQTP